MMKNNMLSWRLFFCMAPIVPAKCGLTGDEKGAEIRNKRRGMGWTDRVGRNETLFPLEITTLEGWLTSGPKSRIMSHLAVSLLGTHYHLASRWTAEEG